MRSRLVSIGILAFCAACASEHRAGDASMPHKAKKSADAGKSTGMSSGARADMLDDDAGDTQKHASSSGCDAGAGCMTALDGSAGDAGHMEMDASRAHADEDGGSTTADAGSDSGGQCAAQSNEVDHGNLLLIFDQSQSMLDKWGSTDKLNASIDAIHSVVDEFKDSLTIGAIFLPVATADASTSCIAGPEGSFVAPIDGPGNLPFEPGAPFLDHFSAHWMMAGTGSGVGTPLNEAFDRADVALTAALPSLQGRTAVVVLTDGMPNCIPDPARTGVPTKTEMVRAADWLMKGIATYVFGLPGADGVMYLGDIAHAGGTGTAIIPSDPSSAASMLRATLLRGILRHANSDPMCGGCTSACGDGTTCVDGSCACPVVGQVPCHGQCIYPNDDANCGACGNACGANTKCCAGFCRDFRTDAQNCGACGTACSTTGDSCTESTCKCGTGAACASPKVCMQQLFANPVCQ